MARDISDVKKYATVVCVVWAEDNEASARICLAFRFVTRINDVLALSV